MRIADAVKYLRQMDHGGRPIKKIESKRMTGNVLILITEDTQSLPRREGGTMTTRRLSVFVGNDRQTGIILATRFNHDSLASRVSY